LKELVDTLTKIVNKAMCQKMNKHSGQLQKPDPIEIVQMQPQIKPLSPLAMGSTYNNSMNNNGSALANNN